MISSGKMTSGFGLVKRLALGADICYLARGKMMALDDSSSKMQL
ncbi:MAG: hypothetical protein Ct9H300mP28_14420 [Pseudomonadota bacterium]|nr:MAG: hypothetical protein Ct9H300mP28_14420 [Pseudomonadota bacterium]